MRVLCSGTAVRSTRGRSLHVPIRFGDEVLGAVGVSGSSHRQYTESDLGLLADWAALLGIRINGSHLAAANSKLEALVGTDSLTGLRNRRGLTAELDRIWNVAQQGITTITVILPATRACVKSRRPLRPACGPLTSALASATKNS
jgi:GAF domain-containing protein